MLHWLTETAGPGYASAMLWTLGALAILLVVLIGIRVFRSLTFGTYVMGGRQRRHRLAVSDATAVDSHRRLVLVRRDDVEHLILIGGPTDVVVEQNIRTAESHSAAAEERPRIDAPAPPAARPRPQLEPRPPQPAVPEAPARPGPAETARPAPVQQARPAPARPPLAQDASIPAPPRPAPAAARPEPRREAPVAIPPRAEAAGKDLDAALLDELNVTLAGQAKAGDNGRELTIEDEMNRLLGDLSDVKRS